MAAAVPASATSGCSRRNTRNAPLVTTRANVSTGRSTGRGGSLLAAPMVPTTMNAVKKPATATSVSSVRSRPRSPLATQATLGPADPGRVNVTT